MANSHQFDVANNQIVYPHGSRWGDGTNEVSIESDGDMTFLKGAGLNIGGISVKDNANTDTLNSAAKVQFLDFGTDDPSNGAVTPDHTNDHITIGVEGYYSVSFSATVANGAAQSHLIDVSVWKNNGATELLNVHAHRTLAGGSTDVGSLSGGPGIVDLAAADTLEIWLDTSAAADRVVTMSDCVLTVIQLAGT